MPEAGETSLLFAAQAHSVRLVQEKSEETFNALAFDGCEYRRFIDGRRRRDPPGECLVRIRRADIQKRVAAFAGKDLRNHSFNRRVFADVCCCFVCGMTLVVCAWPLGRSAAREVMRTARSCKKPLMVLSYSISISIARR